LLRKLNEVRDSFSFREWLLSKFLDENNQFLIGYGFV
jgi:hypothetical protein